MAMLFAAVFLLRAWVGGAAAIVPFAHCRVRVAHCLHGYRIWNSDLIVVLPFDAGQ